MPGGCFSGTITHRDGSTIDVSYLAWVEGKLKAFVIWAGGALVLLTLVWALLRRVRSSLE